MSDEYLTFLVDRPHPRTVGGRVAHWATQQPDREVYIFRSPRIGRLALTRRQVRDMSLTFALRLGRLGVTKGDVVCNTLQNSPERVVADLGIMTAGAVLLDKRAFHRDLTDMVGLLNQSEARLVIVDPGEKGEDGFLSAWEAIRSRCTVISDVDAATGSVTVTWPDVTSLQRVLFCSRGETGTEFDFLKSLEAPGQRSASDRDSNHPPKVEPQDLVVFFPTSGSTGLPKLSVFTHTDLLDTAQNFTTLFDLSDVQVVFQDRPLGWLAGFHQVFLSKGCPRVLTDGRTQVPESCAESVWTYIAEEGVKFAHLTPKTVSRLMSRPDLIAKHGVRVDVLLVTGQPVRKDMAKVIGVLADSMHSMYGATETGFISSARCLTQEDFDDFLVGFPHATSEVLVVDESLRPVDSGVTGRVLVRVQGQFEGYFREEAKTRAALLPGGWFNTDDIGKLDAQGRLFMYGRQSDAIMRGVVIVYPYAMEKRLAAIPGVEDVMVVAVPDPEVHHEICACVVPGPGSDVTTESLREAYRDGVSAKWRDEDPVAKFVLFFDDGFPTTVTGKVNRKQVQLEACQRLGLDASQL